jgi:hypothetical protein
LEDGFQLLKSGLGQAALVASRYLLGLLVFYAEGEAVFFEAVPAFGEIAQAGFLKKLILQAGGKQLAAGGLFRKRVQLDSGLLEPLDGEVFVHLQDVRGLAGIGARRTLFRRGAIGGMDKGEAGKKQKDFHALRFGWLGLKLNGPIRYGKISLGVEFKRLFC